MTTNVPTKPMPHDRIAELVVRHHLGEYRKRPAVQRRLDELFAATPPIPGTFDLLLRACEHLVVTGHDLERQAELAVQRKIATGTDANAAQQHSSTAVA